MGAGDTKAPIKIVSPEQFKDYAWSPYSKKYEKIVEKLFDACRAYVIFEYHPNIFREAVVLFARVIDTLKVRGVKLRIGFIDIIGLAMEGYSPKEQYDYPEDTPKDERELIDVLIEANSLNENATKWLYSKLVDEYKKLNTDMPHSAASSSLLLFIERWKKVVE